MEEGFKLCPFCGCYPRSDMVTATYCENQKCPIADIEMDYELWNKRAGDERPHWISVNERMPENMNVVYVYAPGKGIKDLYTYDGTWFNKPHDWEITHWAEIERPEAS